MDLLKMNPEEMAAKVVKDFTNAENYRASYEKQWKENYRLYRSKLEESKKKKKGSNLFIPYTWANVEQLKARVWQSLFGTSPYIGFAANNELDVDGAKIMEQLVYWQMKERVKLPVKFIDALTSIFVYGTAIALDEWRYEEKSKRVKSPVVDPISGVQTGEEIIKKLFTVYDDPDVSFISVDDFYPDSEGWDMKSCGFACTRVDRDTNYLLKMQENKKYKLPSGFELDSGQIVENFRDSINGITSAAGNVFAERNKKHELITHYTEQSKIVVLNRKDVILAEENKNDEEEMPFTRIVAFPLEKEFWGESVVTVLEHLQNELNTMRNQRLDNVSLVLNKMFKKRRGADIDTADIRSEAGHVIEVDDMDDLDSFDFQDVTSSSFQEEQITKADMQFITGVSEQARGAAPSRKETATTTQIMNEASNIIFNYMTMMIETTGLIPIADRMKKLNQQYVSDEKVFRLFNKASGAWQFNKATPDQIQGDYDAVTTSPRLESQKTKEAKRDQLMQMFEMFAKNPITQPYINVYEMMKKIIESYEIEDYEKLLNNPQPMPQTGDTPPAISGDFPQEMMQPGQEVPPGQISEEELMQLIASQQGGAAGG